MIVADLTADQRAQLMAFMALYRPNAGGIARMLNSLDQMAGVYASTVGAIIDGLDADAVIGDETGLAGAATLTAGDVASMMTQIGAVLAAFNQTENRATYVRAAGLANTMGQLV